MSVSVDVWVREGERDGEREGERWRERERGMVGWREIERASERQKLEVSGWVGEWVGG